MLEGLVKSGKLYGYNTDTDEAYGAKGIVIADSEYEARTKIVDAYKKHGCSDSELTNLSIWKVTDGWFDDAPDVLEIQG